MFPVANQFCWCSLPHLFPSRVNWLADQECRIRTGTRAELLCAPIGYLGDIEIAFLVYTHPMRVEQTPREIARVPHA